MASKILLAAACFALVDAQYSYDRCAANGPAGWASLPNSQCGGSQNTPIDLCSASPFPPKPGRRDHDDDDDDKSSKKSSYWYKLSDSYDDKVQLTLKNVGKTIELSGPSPTVSAPGLHELVGRNPPDTVSNPEWVFAQLHLHWGRDGNPNEGSEHAVGGLRYAAEAHFVHFNRARGATLGAAVASGRNDALLVIGTFLEQGPASEESKLVRVMSSYVPSLETAPGKTVQIAEKLKLSDLINPKGAFYSYGGGLTTPGCLEIVTWIVQAKPQVISAESLELLKTAMEAPNKPMSLYGNFRPLQPLNSRTLYLSKGESPTCGKVVLADTCFQCNKKSDTVGKTSLPTEQATPAETTTSSTPSWVWIVIGVCLPATALVAVLGTLYYTTWRQRQVSGDEMVVFTPLPEMRGPMPSSIADEAL